ncbi:response regulator [Cohnella sp. REN36]|uniref:response regulator transcription factor n=1 Tax=Cohnella sp. REN36 TaxID=2887347 RepID=UPI001D134C55|nr:response regulator [Cohnella sp. REN36]MCC3373549.1 response regulator [Cohnella sp. REN36]
MMKALIVDDEKLVRMGFISVMPWEKFDICVVGEAGNGKKALEWMEQNQVDLVFVDLTMPVMNGFELMSEMRARYPYTWIVVLTCHQDFGYVQEALRMGAIDFIVKTQLEVDSMDEVLTRIVGRIHYEITAKQPATPAKQEKTIVGGWLLVHLQGTPEAGAVARLQSACDGELMEVDPSAWLLPWSGDRQEMPPLPPVSFDKEWTLIKVDETQGVSPATIIRTLRKHLPTYLYYVYEARRHEYELSFPTLAQVDIGKRAREQQALLEQWQSLHWLYDDAQFEALCHATVILRPDVEQLRCEIAVGLGRCIVLTSEEKLNSYLQSLSMQKHWHRDVEQLEEIRKFMRSCMRKYPYFPDIVVGILHAIHYINQTDDFEISRDEAAAKFNLSQGYFSQCFKEIVGQSFGHYLRERKMIRAQDLLVRTNLPIYTIAERIGFKDEKYFSKMFRSYRGAAPAEYRKAMKGRDSAP